MIETWNPILRFTGYKVSDFGNIKDSVGNLLTKSKRLGYSTVWINNKNRSVSRIVATAFHPNPENKKTVNHKNGIKRDDTAINLEWATQSENNTHAYRVLGKKPFSPKGIIHGLSKLNDAAVIDIRKSTDKLKPLSEKYGVTVSVLSKARRGDTWKHVSA